MKPLLISILFLMIISYPASALDLLVGAGIGKDVLAPHQPFERYGTLGLRYGDVWKLQTNGGYYLTTAEGQRPSYYTSLQTGMEVVSLGGQFGSLMFGPAYLSQPDDHLSGHFQFHLTGGIGFKNTTNWGIGSYWTHFSNAGISQPNLGRDLLTGQLTIPIR